MIWSNPVESPHSRKDARRSANLDFDARVPIPFSVFPSSYRSDAVPHLTPEKEEGQVHLDHTSHVDREDTGAARLPEPRVYGQEEVDLHLHRESHPSPRKNKPRRDEFVDISASSRVSHPEVHLTRESYREPSVRFQDKPTYDQSVESQIDITEREYRRRVHPTYDVNHSRDYPSDPVDSYSSPPQATDVSYSRAPREDVPYDRAYQPAPVDIYPAASAYSRSAVDSQPAGSIPAVSSRSKVSSPTTVVDQPPRKMGYYDDDGKYHSFRRGVERAADRIMHPFHHDHHHHHHDSEDAVVADDRGPVRFRDGVREEVRVVEPRARPTKDTVPIPCHYIRVGDILILQGRPCQVIRVSVSPQTGQHRYLGVDLFSRQLQEESSFVSNPSPSVVVQTMLGPVYKTYRILDLLDDGRIVAMTESGDVKQGLQVVTQGGLFRRIRDAFEEGRGSVRALVINDGGRELVVDFKVIHGSRL
ncbi:putative Woronin body protein HexA [Aspergillus candidus]|uniref:Woronin body major protein n=1 Tax=Aspergillus candidus TaxID=41067 RepID=A0A2I2FBB7_ASPCN|nr:woronin body major protein [Aspergillus candidus]PLB37935.1 woronin body major protein [Aspergillus candidus]